MSDLQWYLIPPISFSKGGLAYYTMFSQILPQLIKMNERDLFDHPSYYSHYLFHVNLNKINTQFYK